MRNYKNAIAILQFIKLLIPEDMSKEGAMNYYEIVKAFDLAIESLQMRREAQKMIDSIGTGASANEK